MTTTLETRQQAAARVVPEFFDAYRRRDVVAMADLCCDNDDFKLRAVRDRGKQRFLRSEGKVHTVGRTIWTGPRPRVPDSVNHGHLTGRQRRWLRGG
jgi:hypothetical protein